MSKGLEALEDLMNDLTPMSFSRIEKLDRYKVIEKELKRLEELENENLVLTFGNTVNQGKLKALEIIKEKRIDIDCLIKWLKKDDYELYHHTYLHHREDLEQQEYDLLKEVLL